MNRLILGSAVCRRLAMLAVVAMLSACTSLHTVDFSNDGHLQLQPGDKLVVTMRDGSTQKLTLTAVDQNRLQGETVDVPLSDVASLQVARFDKKKTIWLTIGIIAIGAAAGSGGGGGGGGGGY